MFPLIVVVLAFGVTLAAQESSEPFSHPPTSFSAEDIKFPDAVPLPSCVRASLAADEHVASMLTRQNLSARDLPAEWFTASQQSLGARTGALVVVMGTGLIGGANINPFWVFQVRSNSCSLLLSTAGHDLILLKHRTNGLPDVRAMAATATTTSEGLYRFNGHKYRLVQKKSYPNGN